MSIYRGRTCRDLYLASILYDAIDDHNLKAVNLLLERGSDPNLILPQKGISSFHRIIGCDSLDFTMKATCSVLQFGGNPNIRSDDGLTPLHIAAAWGRPEIIKILLSCGGDPEAKDSNYMTPINYAIKGEFPECTYLLKSYLPVINLLDKKQEDCCNINLDRVLVNNGLAIGEYHILPEQHTDSINRANHMNYSTKDDISEYVMNWFDKCESDVKRKISIVSTDNEICEKNLPLRKPQRKPKEGSISINPENYSSLENVCKADEHKSPKQFREEKLSNESGIVVSSNEHRTLSSYPEVNPLNQNLGSDAIYHNLKIQKCDKSESSDYKTCSNSVLERNIFEITEDLTCNRSNNMFPSALTMNESSFIAVSEIYKYEDKEEGIILFERRLVKSPSECGDSMRSGSFSSKISSLPDTFDYDSDTLRMELTTYGYVPGPITVTTKRLYLKKLYRLKKHPPLHTVEVNRGLSQKIFSVELEKTRTKFDCFKDLTFYKFLEETVIKEFSIPDQSRKWREGLNKSSFTYLLLDPRITKNLPCRSETLEPKEVWDIFLSAVFYIGKGKKTRPYSHLYDAVSLWKTGKFDIDSSKLKLILDIWKNDAGVICLHVFHNIIPVEAYTREASMIAAMKLDNLTNSKSGEFYGVAAAWPQRNKKSLGVYLLYKAMNILLQDGERQIYPRDIE